MKSFRFYLINFASVTCIILALFQNPQWECSLLRSIKKKIFHQSKHTVKCTCSFGAGGNFHCTAHVMILCAHYGTWEVLVSCLFFTVIVEMNRMNIPQNEWYITVKMYLKLLKRGWLYFGCTCHVRVTVMVSLEYKYTCSTYCTKSWKIISVHRVQSTEMAL